MTISESSKPLNNGRAGYTSSPRPTFERAAAIPYNSVTRHLWGDAGSGPVADWIYASTDKVHCLVFGLPPRGWFKHSDSYRTIFGADVTYHVLSGVMVIANPQTGEVHRVLPGETAFFRRDTWHHAFNYSDEPLRALEFFAPPPSTGTSGAYAQKQPYLPEADSRYTRDEWLGKLPMARTEAQAGNAIRVIREADLEWRLEGATNPALVGIVVASEHLTVGKLSLLPGQHTEPQAHGGDKVIYVTEGTLNVKVHDGQRPDWFEMKPGDGCFVPAGTSHECWNITGAPVSAMFGVAPRYLV
jgi:quercetin dioxygenase-like cupin family protein